MFVDLLVEFYVSLGGCYRFREEVVDTIAGYFRETGFVNTLGEFVNALSIIGR